MAEIHPNDIGLATFEDVGDVAKLRTAAKVVVDAINELQENKGENSGLNFEQLYVDGENNIIIGRNNVVYGSNNLIIGSDNIVIGDSLNIVSDKVKKYNEFDSVMVDEFEAGQNMFRYYVDYDYTGETLPFKVGDKVAVSITVSWTTEYWDDYVDIESGVQIAEIVSIDEENQEIYVDNINISSDPPDEIHTVYTSATSTFIPLASAYKMYGKIGNFEFGRGAAGDEYAFATGMGQANSPFSFAANRGNVNSHYATALCSAEVKGLYGFGANTGKCYGENASAFNYGYCYAPYSVALGYYARTYGRVLKCVSLDTENNKLTIESGQDTNGLTGKEIVIRCYSTLNTFMFSTAIIENVKSNELTLTDTSFGLGSNAPKLFPESYAFVIDTSNSYARGALAGGNYAIAGNKYSFAFGEHVLAGADCAVIFGKYGNLTDKHSFGIGNGTSLKAPGMAFKVLTDGSVHADAAYTTPCADYAEFFEWDDGNENAEDRTGYFVKLKGDKITKCDEFDEPLGIVSATPAIVGDSGELHWKDKFVTDDFGRIQYHEVLIPEEKDEEGNIIIEEHIETQPVLNPQWNADEVYIPRKERKEWSPVGVFGKLIVCDDGTLKQGDICRPGKGGIAVKSVKNGYQVLKRISDDKIMIWFRG